MKTATNFALEIREQLSRFLESHPKKVRDDTKEDEGASIVQSLEKTQQLMMNFARFKDQTN